jgi:signal peptidase I
VLKAQSDRRNMEAQVHSAGVRRAPRRWGLIVPIAALAIAILLPLCVLLGTAFLAGWKFQPIETGSMAPNYPTGSLAVVEPVDAARVKPGMVIVFEDPLVSGRLVAHRVVKRLPGESPRWVTKGDANDANDPVPISASAIQGRARWAIPGAGRVVSAATGWLAVVVLVGLPLALLLATELRARWRRSSTSPAGAVEPCPACGRAPPSSPA